MWKFTIWGSVVEPPSGDCSTAACRRFRILRLPYCEWADRQRLKQAQSRQTANCDCEDFRAQEQCSVFELSLKVCRTWAPHLLTLPDLRKCKLFQILLLFLTVCFPFVWFIQEVTDVAFSLFFSSDLCCFLQQLEETCDLKSRRSLNHSFVFSYETTSLCCCCLMLYDSTHLTHVILFVSSSG